MDADAFVLFEAGIELPDGAQETGAKAQLRGEMARFAVDIGLRAIFVDGFFFDRKIAQVHRLVELRQIPHLKLCVLLNSMQLADEVYLEAIGGEWQRLELSSSPDAGANLLSDRP